MCKDVVVISGYFAAPYESHKGYQTYLKKAKEISPNVIAIHANDEQCIRKYGRKIERQKFPDCINIIAIDDDDTVIKTLSLIRALSPGTVTFFKDGGEYSPETLPEYGIGGVTYIFGTSPKEDSSSQILGINKQEGETR